MQTLNALIYGCQMCPACDAVSVQVHGQALYPLMTWAARKYSHDACATPMQIAKPGSST